MKDAKRKKLTAAGWRVGSTDEFLGLTENEIRAVDGAIGSKTDAAVTLRDPLIVEVPTVLTRIDAQLRAPQPPQGATFDDLHIPEGWALEPLERCPDHALLSTPSPRRYMATIDFRMRGFRNGLSMTGRLVGEEWNKRRKKYGGRGWRQSLVDDAVAHLQEVLR